MNKLVTSLAALCWFASSTGQAQTAPTEALPQFPLWAKTTETGINLSKNPQYQFGVDFNFDLRKNSNGTNIFPKSAFDKDVFGRLNPRANTSESAGAFFNYRLNSDYALTSGIKYNTISQTNWQNWQLSLGAKTVKIFNRRNRISTSLNFNWSSLAQTNNDLWGRGESLSNLARLNQFTPQLNRSELHLNSSWNWDINANWSLSSGISARQVLNKNPFINQRTPVTVFSVATYRF
ncbi:MAG: MipA/OmpV family protein [Undibacterium sp.]|nr:MipA/OmpV family protein [Undibacterium sp.]